MSGYLPLFNYCSQSMLLYLKMKKSRKFRQVLTLECPQMHRIFNRILVHGIGMIVFKKMIVMC